MKLRAITPGKDNPTRSSRLWRRIVVVAGLTLVATALAVTAFIAANAIRFAEGSLTPPRMDLDRTPLEANIGGYSNVSFVANDGVTLRGWYIPPENGAIIILAHGYAHNRLMLLPEAQFLSEQGYGALLFDFRGHGESDDALVTLGDHEQRDMNAAIDFVAAQPGVEEIGALGFSMGAATLIQVAAQDDRLSAIIVEAAFPTLREEIRYRSRALGFLSQLPSLWTVRRAGVGVNEVNPIDDLCMVSPRPTLLIYGEMDADVPPGTPQAMLDAACDPVDLWVIEGAAHQNYSEVVPKEYSERVLAFFDMWLLSEGE
jgi:dipeptidyl aminopeptidase/acylaminoacyl peptidase